LQRNPKRACGSPSVDYTNCDVDLNVGLWQLKHCKPDVIHSREYRHFIIALSDDIALFDTLFDNIARNPYSTNCRLDKPLWLLVSACHQVS
jgi:hypothetical protein